MRHLFFALVILIFTSEYTIILSQGEYCERLLDESDYFGSVDDVINCYTDVSNYPKALEHIEKLIYEYDILLNPPTRLSEEAVYFEFIDLQGLIALQLLNKYDILIKIQENDLQQSATSEITDDQILEPLNEAIARLNGIVYPGDNVIELYNKLVLLDVVEDNYEDWYIGRNDSLQQVYYDVLKEKLNYSNTYEEYILEYPLYTTAGTFAKKMRVNFEITRALIAKAKFYLTTANNESEIMEALAPLELAKNKELSMQEDTVLYWIGITHLFANNQTLGCKAIKEACIEYKNKSSHYYSPDWSQLQELTKSCSDCDCD